MTPGWVATVELYAIWVAAIATTTFVLAYGLGSPWRCTRVGRAMLSKNAAIAALLDVTVFDHYYGTKWSALAYVGLVIILAIAASYAYWLAAFVLERWTVAGRRRGRRTTPAERHVPERPPRNVWVDEHPPPDQPEDSE